MSKTFDEVMASQKRGRRRDTYEMFLSPDANSEYRALEEELVTVINRRDRANPEAANYRRAGDDDKATEIAEKMAAIRETNDELVYVLQLEQARRADWLKLRAEHPPRDGVAFDGGLFNYETFPPAALRLCLLEPEPTDEVMEFLEELLSNGEWEAISMKIWTLNEGARSVPKSVLASSILGTS